MGTMNPTPTYPVPDALHVQAVLQRIVPAFDPLQVIVFGSYARREQQPGSDLDLLVVLPDAKNRLKATAALRHAVADLPLSKDIIVTTPEEIAQRRDSCWHIVGYALREGRTVYTRKAP